ncbi:unnamed protein product [Durusdinium trenchii]|uniref:CENP-V/GFA domain-containing protein n=1 Tax=Durusdinium trenchii TaxID=1381693 RepID=A0ABP0S1K0_9DINO
MAKHKGSVFGALGEEPQPSSEQLRNDLALEWSRLSSSRWVFLEDEGARIGEAVLPSSLFHRLRQAPLVLHLDVPFQLRAERSLQLYGAFGGEALCGAVEHFRHRMGHQRTDQLQQQLRDGQLRPVCEEILRNYDKAYDYHLKRGRSSDCIVQVEVNSSDCARVAQDLACLAAEREADAPEAPVTAPQNLPKAEEVRESRCFCGAVITEVRGDPAAVSICHCSVCRRLSGAPFVASAIFLPQRVTVKSDKGSEPQLVELKTSKQVSRLRCAVCSAPVAGRLGQRFVALPWAGFMKPGDKVPEAWTPSHHLHYDSRVMDVEDDLIKYRARSRGPVWDAAAPREQSADDHPESTGATSPPPGAAPAAAPGPVALVSPMAAPMPEAWSKELLLTGHAAAAGHAVTYTTTTTTTTAVTINGAAASPGAAFTPQAPAGPPIEYAPQAAPGQPPASPSGPGGPGGGGREKALPAPEPTEEDMKAMVAARQLNNGIPRAGPLPLQWSSSSPSGAHEEKIGDTTRRKTDTMEC